MYIISENIYDSIIGKDIKIKELNSLNRLNLIESINEKFIDNNKKGGWIWEKFYEYESMYDNKSWSYIKDFVLDKECILFFNQDEEKKMFLIQNGDDLNYILSETYGFEFYVTDKKCSFLICFNHHDILYGCGDANRWVKEIKYRLLN